MTKRTVPGVFSALCALLVGACSSGTSVEPPAQQAPVSGLDARGTSAQYLYVYNTGSPGIYTGEFARYSLPYLKLQEMTAADGVASNEVFGSKSLPYFVDEVPQGGFGV